MPAESEVMTERCGIDTVEISRIEKLISDHDRDGLLRFFTEEELSDAGTGSGQAGSLAARFAAKEACCKLFPKEIGLGQIEPYDFSVKKSGYGAPVIQTSENAQKVLDRYRIAGINISLTHAEKSASAMAFAVMNPISPPWYGKAMFHLLPIRRKVVLENLNRVFGDVIPEKEITSISQAYYGHFLKFIAEFFRMPFLTAKQKRNIIRLEGVDILTKAHDKGKGVLLLTGHFGNWEVGTVAGIAQFQEFRGLFHFIRRPLKPRWLNELVMRRFTQAGFGTLGKTGSLDEILELLEKNSIVVSIFDQFTIQKFGVLSEFFGHPASTFKSLSILAQATGAPVVPASSWREKDGTHVLRFEEPIPFVEAEKSSEVVRRNTRNYNAALEKIILRHPEQWIWMHKRWKALPPRKKRIRQ